MVIDTSAIIAILFREPEAARIFDVIRTVQQPDRVISTASFLEAHTVVHSRTRERGIQDLDALFYDLSLSFDFFSSAQLVIARQAWTRYGKTSGHKAKLNFGDCFSYALAKQRNEPLLCKGDDFVHTDIQIVAY